jgi:hypothetical protein
MWGPFPAPTRQKLQHSGADATPPIRSVHNRHPYIQGILSPFLRPDMGRRFDQQRCKSNNAGRTSFSDNADVSVRQANVLFIRKRIIRKALLNEEGNARLIKLVRRTQEGFVLRTVRFLQIRDQAFNLMCLPVPIQGFHHNPGEFGSLSECLKIGGSATLKSATAHERFTDSRNVVTMLSEKSLPRKRNSEHHVWTHSS